MELPDDVLRLIREYAKPSESYKIYQRVLYILNQDTLSVDYHVKLKTAVRYHLDRFRPLFLELEKTHSELRVAVDAVMRNDTQIYTVSQLRMEYYRKRQDFTFKRCDVMNELYSI
jgi:hypothetical protein